MLPRQYDNYVSIVLVPLTYLHHWNYIVCYRIAKGFHLYLAIMRIILL